MYLIVLCDDEEAELNKTRQMLGRYKKIHPEAGFTVECFDNADKLLYLVKEKGYRPDLIFMDIYMPEKLGIDVAKDLRNMGYGSRIVFLTMSKEHALDAFGVDATQYLVKPVSCQVLFALLDRFFKEMNEMSKQYLIFRVEGRIQRVALNDIEYCEAHGKTQVLYLSDGTQHVLRMTMSEIYAMLSQYKGFARAGVAYIISLGHIDNLNAMDVTMHDGKKIYLPRGAYKNLKEQYFQYYCGEG